MCKIDKAMFEHDLKTRVRDLLIERVSAAEIELITGADQKLIDRINRGEIHFHYSLYYPLNKRANTPLKVRRNLL